VRIVGVFVGVENVSDGEFADRDDQSVGSLRAAEFVCCGVYFLGIAAEIDGLPDEGARHAGIGHRNALFHNYYK